MNTNKLYAGNLNYSVTSDELGQVFEEYGTVKSSNVIEGKGFGFVEMSTNEEAQTAMDELNEAELRGRTMRISEAKPRQSRTSSYNRNNY
ncbi:MAG: RNA-binding protein [Candidatus Cloacimonadota bacterium]|nr:MAG: RNA-binding protein [Candidatus Cloacimonadota bacterium]PIE77819.1 MAG: RNA-binding protein [Candidatus Delongbacteria bacterium]